MLWGNGERRKHKCEGQWRRYEFQMMEQLTCMDVFEKSSMVALTQITSHRVRAFQITGFVQMLL